MQKCFTYVRRLRIPFEKLALRHRLVLPTFIAFGENLPTPAWKAPKFRLRLAVRAELFGIAAVER